jgi:hypothetical protein
MFCITSVLFSPRGLPPGVHATRNAFAPEASGDGNSARPAETSIATLWGQKHPILSIVAPHAWPLMERAINMLLIASVAQFACTPAGRMTF